MLMVDLPKLTRPDQFAFPQWAAVMNKSYTKAGKMKLSQVLDFKKDLEPAEEELELFSREVSISKSEALLLVTPWIQGVPESAMIQVHLNGEPVWVAPRPVHPYLVTDPPHRAAYPGSLSGGPEVYCGVFVDSGNLAHPQQMLGVFLLSGGRISVYLKGVQKGLPIKAGLTAARYRDPGTGDVAAFCKD